MFLNITFSVNTMFLCIYFQGYFGIKQPIGMFILEKNSYTEDSLVICSSYRRGHKSWAFTHSL